MAKKTKYYVVWAGQKPGIYRTWAECELQIKGFVGARYKSFESETAARKAFEEGAPPFVRTPKGQPATISTQVIWDSISVDAACSGNPGAMEYRGVDTRTKEVLFEKKFILGTNNIGEFLAIVHALALTSKQGISTPIYSDSQIAIGWVFKKRCATKLERSSKTAALYELIERAEVWLRQNHWNNQLLKWDTEHWGEIPADYGRKS